MYIYLYTYIYICMYKYIFRCIYIYMYKCICTCAGMFCFINLHIPIIAQLICPSIFLLHKALTDRRPPIGVTIGVVKNWWQHHRTAPKTAGISSAKELQEQYGARITPLVASRVAIFIFYCFNSNFHISDFGPVCQRGWGVPI